MKKMKFSEHDFEVSGLPTKRRQQFADIIKIRWRTLLGIGLLILLSAVPLFLAVMFKDIKAIQISQNVTDETELYGELLYNQMFFSLLYVPSAVVIFIILAGVMRIFRNLCWGEGIFFFQDFRTGVKQNWKRYMTIGILISVLYDLMILAANVIDIDFVRYVPAAICLIILFPCLLVMSEYDVVYNNNFFKSFANSMTLIFKKPHLYYPFYLLFILPLIALHVSAIPYLIKYIVFAVSFFALYPLLILVWTLFNYSVFDEFINKESHKDIYKKGLNSIDFEK